MTSLAAALTRPVVSRTTAEGLGALSGIVLDPTARTVVAWQVSKGRHRYLVDHAHVAGIGNDAVIVDDERNLRKPHGDRESAAIRDGRSLLGSLVLSVLGHRMGTLQDIDVDDVSGTIQQVVVSTGNDPQRAAHGHTTHAPNTIRGFGSYALVLAPDSPAPASTPTSAGESR